MFLSALDTCKILFFFQQLFQGISHYCGSIHNGRNANGNHRHTKALPGQRIPVIAHPGTGLNPCIGNLNSPVQSSDTPRSQCIYDNQRIRSGLSHHPFHNFCRLHTGLRHNPRLQGTDQVHFFTVIGRFSVFLYNMSGDKEIVHHLGSQCICGYFPVAQSYHQYGLFYFHIRQQLPDFFRKTLRDLSVIPIVRFHHGRRFHGHINSHGFSHGFGRVFGINHHFCDMDILFLVIILLHSHPPQFAVCFTDALTGLQGQVRPHLITSVVLHGFILLYVSGDCIGFCHFVGGQLRVYATTYYYFVQFFSEYVLTNLLLFTKLSLCVYISSPCLAKVKRYSTYFYTIGGVGLG